MLFKSAHKYICYLELQSTPQPFGGLCLAASGTPATHMHCALTCLVDFFSLSLCTCVLLTFLIFLILFGQGRVSARLLILPFAARCCWAVCFQKLEYSTELALIQCNLDVVLLHPFARTKDLDISSENIHSDNTILPLPLL